MSVADALIYALRQQTVDPGEFWRRAEERAPVKLAQYADLMATIYRDTRPLDSRQRRRLRRRLGRLRPERL